jgi:hypothetical protein
MAKKKVNHNPKRHSPDPCETGYEQVGMKKKAGRKVPNCVPKKSKRS